MLIADTGPLVAMLNVAELAFQDADLMTQREDLGTLVAIADG